MSKNAQIVIYQAKDGRTQLEVEIHRETVWLSQRQMADLFGKNTDTIGLHIRNAFKEKELNEEATTEDSSVVHSEGGRTVRRQLRFYNLDVSRLLTASVDSIVATFRHRVAAGLQTGRNFIIPNRNAQANNQSDFELVTWLVIK